MIQLSESTETLLEMLKSKDADCFFVEKKTYKFKGRETKNKFKGKESSKVMVRVNNTYLNSDCDAKIILEEMKEHDFIKRNTALLYEYFITEQCMDYMDKM